MNNIIIKLSIVQQEIVQDICNIQQDSLLRLYENPKEVLKMYPNMVEPLGLTQENIIDMVNTTFILFQELKENPNSILTLPSIDLSIFQHILAVFGNVWDETYNKDITNLWEIIKGNPLSKHQHISLN